MIAVDYVLAINVGDSNLDCCAVAGGDDGVIAINGKAPRAIYVLGEIFFVHVGNFSLQMDSLKWLNAGRNAVGG